MPNGNGKNTKTVIKNQKVKLTSEERNEMNNTDVFQEAFTSGQGLRADPYANAKDASGIAKSTGWRRGYNNYAKNAKYQGFTFGEPMQNQEQDQPIVVVESGPTATASNSLYSKASGRFMSVVNRANTAVKEGVGRTNEFVKNIKNK